MINRFKKSFTVRLLTLVLLPVIVASVLMTIVSTSKLQSTMGSETVNKLKSSAEVIRSFIETLAEDSFSVDENGVMYADDTDLSYINEVLDEYYQKTGIYATIFFGDTRRLTSVKNGNERATGTPAQKNVSDVVLKGGEYTSMSTPVVGKECVVAYLPLYQPGGRTVCGMVFTGIPKETYTKELMQATINTIVIAVLILALTIAISVFVVRTISRAILGVSKVCNDLAGGDFTQKPASDGIRRADAVGEMVKNVNQVKEHFTEAIGGVKENIDILVKGAEGLDVAAGGSAQSMTELSDAVEGIAHGATTQAQEVETSAREVAEILRTVEEINESVNKTKDCATKMQKNSEEVDSNFNVLITNMSETISKLQDITEKMQHVKDAVETVTTAANDINSIASQTNLLSLNASIEAARAGEAGRGFAVVAGEISTLADQSNNAAVKIRNIMANLKEETDGAVTMVRDMSEMMDKQSETSKSSKNSLEVLIGEIEKTQDTVENVKRNADEVQKLCAGLNDNITSLSAISEENAASAEETSASIAQISEATKNVQDMSEEMKHVAEKLEELTAQFKVNM
ncbi:MAG: methyl-accepting chemotaxis protein [Lachnospiraceae bacterium]|nr:methyl-accepting chemotaxis protein [Lachnospiraceae bacterium]MBP5183674.1 methyl-accepting chemotaxis protein [Lachnospiraceae bacterium]